MPKSIASSFRFHRVSVLAVGCAHNLVQSLRRRKAPMAIAEIIAGKR